MSDIESANPNERIMFAKMVYADGNHKTYNF